MQLSEASARFSRWLTITRDLSPHTVRAYESDVNALEQTLGRRFDSSELAVEHLHRFLEDMTRAGLSSASIRRRYVGVRMFCGWLHRTGVVATNPSVDVSIAFPAPTCFPGLCRHSIFVYCCVRCPKRQTRRSRIPGTARPAHRQR